MKPKYEMKFKKKVKKKYKKKHNIQTKPEKVRRITQKQKQTKKKNN